MREPTDCLWVTRRHDRDLAKRVITPCLKKRYAVRRNNPDDPRPPPLVHAHDPDYCPCGGRKKWGKCHGAPGRGAAADSNALIDAALLDLAKNLVALLKDSIESAELTSADPETQLRQRCILYFAKKMYRATLAGITLIEQGQTSVAFTIKRDQHYAWLAFHYYLENQRQSILFAASGPLRQRDDAKAIMEFDPDVAADPKRQKQLQELEAAAEAIIKRFPDLRVPRGKSGNTKSPVLRDWKEPDEHAMAEWMVRTWLVEEAKLGRPVPANEEDQWCERRVRSMRFFHAAFPSQELHGTPMGFIGDLPNDETDLAAVAGLNVDPHEPNGLIYIYLWYTLGVAGKMVEFFQESGFRDRLIKIRKAMERYRVVFSGDVSPGS